MTAQIPREKFARVNVVGTPGSGKSTFAKKLAVKLGHPQVEMDRLFWRPDWEMSSDEEFFAKLRDSLSCENWVLDGNYDRTLDIKWNNVTSVIWLDYSFPLTFYRVFKRAFHRALTQQELWPGTGNRESFSEMFFSKESIVLFMMQSYRPIKKRYESRMKDPKFSHIHFVRLTHPRETDRFLETI